MQMDPENDVCVGKERNSFYLVKDAEIRDVDEAHDGGPSADDKVLFLFVEKAEEPCGFLQPVCVNVLDQAVQLCETSPADAFAYIDDKESSGRITSDEHGRIQEIITEITNPDESEE